MNTVGLAYEGNRDLEALKIIILRLAREFGQEFQFSQHKRGINNAHTMIIPYVKTFTEYMFDDAEVDFAFYFTDQDKDSSDRRQQIIEKVESCGVAYAEKSFVGVPVPHFEAWLTADQDTVKSVLQYDHTRPLPFADMSPKNQLQTLVQESEVDILLEDTKKQIVTNMSFDKLCRCRVGFKEFYSGFRQYFNNLNNS